MRENGSRVRIKFGLSSGQLFHLVSELQDGVSGGEERESSSGSWHVGWRVSLLALMFLMF